MSISMVKRVEWKYFPNNKPNGEKREMDPTGLELTDDKPEGQVIVSLQLLECPIPGGDSRPAATCPLSANVLPVKHRHWS